MTDKYFIENLFGINGLNIAWYGVIIGFGILLGVLIACREANRQNLQSDIIFDFLLLALPIAIICARIYYVAFEWEQYTGNFMKMIAIWVGGRNCYIWWCYRWIYCCDYVLKTQPLSNFSAYWYGST